MAKQLCTNIAVALAALAALAMLGFVAIDAAGVISDMAQPSAIDRVVLAEAFGEFSPDVNGTMWQAAQR